MDGDRDTFVKDIIEDDKEETSFNFPNQLNKKDAENEAIVINVSDDVIEHKEDDATAANLIEKNEAMKLGRQVYVSLHPHVKYYTSGSRLYFD